MTWLKITVSLFLCIQGVVAQPNGKKLSQKEAAQKLVTIAATIQNHELQLSAVEHDLNRARAEEGAILAELDHHNQRLMETIHYLRHATQYTPLLAMLSAPKPEDVIHSSMLLRSITPEIHQRNQQLLEKVHALSDIRNTLERKQNQLQDLTFNYYQERESLDLLLNTKSQTPPTLDESTSEPPNELTLRKPVVGKLIPSFGSTDPELASYNGGVLFVTRSEAQVISPVSGTIVFAGDYAKGQGKMVSIQTPNYLIILSGLETLNRNCSVGHNVVVGEPIGVMQKINSKKNKTSVQKQPRLYLEVWNQEQTIDPQSILQEKGKDSHVS
jgi:septal ring factor EnvC (AmiA/AmiB activator)